MPCPLCTHQLQKLNIEANHGDRILVHHCGQCGGTWFDHENIYRLPHHELVRFAEISVKPKTPHFTTHEYHCPNDQKKLVRYHSETSPLGVVFFHCTRCHGIWATQKNASSVVHEREISLGQTTPEPSPAHTALPIVFVPTIALVFLLISTFFTIQHVQETKINQTHAIELIRGTQITQISPTMTVITFYTSTPVRSAVTYRSSLIDRHIQEISNIPTNHHRILLTSLSPEMKYRYTITLVDSEGHSFTTPEALLLTNK